jgi:hypothetical protein
MKYLSHSIYGGFTMKISKITKLLGIFSLVCLVTLSMISAAAAAPDVCRDLPDTAIPGEEITVILDITDDGTVDKTAIQDSVPAGWVVGEPSWVGSIANANTVFWFFTNEPAVTQVTYKVTIPDDAAPGPYTFVGEFDLVTGGPDTNPIVCGDMQINVVAGPGPGPVDELNVCRDLPDSAIPGEEITVILDITDDGTADKTAIQDIVPAGWAVGEPSWVGSIANANTVFWFFTDEPTVTQVTYKVTIPDDAAPGPYTFVGEFDLATGDLDAYPIVCGDMQINVVAGTGPDVCRDLPVSAVPGEKITVILDITLDGADKTAIQDSVPAEWVVSDPSWVGSIADANTVFWFNPDEPVATQLTYDVTIPEDAALGPYTFVGEFDLATGGLDAYPIVCGDMQIEIVEPCDPEPEPECPVTEYDPIVIEPCWNFMSVPFALNNSSVEFVLADINYTNLVYWNTSGAIWEIPTDFEPLKAYWIESNESVDQMISSEILEPLTPVVPPTMTVYPGWNAIGYTDSMAILPAELMLGSIDESYMVVIGPYDSATGMYEQVGHNGETGVISGIHVGTDIFDMGPYEGFWVYVTQEDTLAGF